MIVDRGMEVQTASKLKPNLNDKSLPELFINSRRRNMKGTVDSAIYTTFNKLWLVRHETSGMVHGISIGHYGIYHEDELEIMPEPVKTSAPVEDDNYDWKELD